MNDSHSIRFLVLIAERGKKDDFHTLIARGGGRVINMIYGKGSVHVSSLMEMLGIIPDVDKIVITCLISSENADEIMEILVKEYKFDKPNTGIAFTIPVEGLSY